MERSHASSLGVPLEADLQGSLSESAGWLASSPMRGCSEETDDVSHRIPVYEGYTLPHAILYLAGRVLAEHLREDLHLSTVLLHCRRREGDCS